MAEPTKEVIEALGKMGIPADVKNLDEWMLEYLQKAGKFPKVKTEEKQQEKQQQAQGYQQPLKLNFFSGEEKPKGGETTFDLWKFDVE